MIRLGKIFIGVFVLGVAIGVSVLLSQVHNNTQAANTIATNYQVVNITGTTDGLAPNAIVNIYGYSADGNVLLFTSHATNLPNASTNGAGGLYEYNISTSAITRVDVSTSGVPANGSIASGLPSISETGRYVVFASHATNLID